MRKLSIDREIIRKLRKNRRGWCGFNPPGSKQGPQANSCED
jgi:hypothetical protein